METHEQPRRIGGFLFAIGLIAVAAVVWAAVALASGPSPTGSDSSTPAAVYYDSAQPAVAAARPNGDCPDHGGGSTTPSTPSSQSTTDGSTNPTL